ncbi:MAG TPA: hypothetical protein GXX35_09860 [Thermoanaerobacterales bacterium]|nr:hypothetical protein [Thermoanaerobacterales bacterium]
MKKNRGGSGYYCYYYPEQDGSERDYGGDACKKIEFGIKDIVAMIIAAFELVLPSLFMIFGVVLGIYFVLKLITGY